MTASEWAEEEWARYERYLAEKEELDAIEAEEALHHVV